MSAIQRPGPPYPGPYSCKGASANFLRNYYLLLSQIKSFFKVLPDSPRRTQPATSWGLLVTWLTHHDLETYLSPPGASRLAWVVVFTVFSHMPSTGPGPRNLTLSNTDMVPVLRELIFWSGRKGINKNTSKATLQMLVSM